ncbi:siderophore biosynthesis protein [Bacteroidia bacterium]|nr:siderophore biosynthesis protein [Bacteroidia bacterium]
MIIRIEAITKTAGELLDQLDQKAWYIPVLAKMGESRQREWLTVRVLLKNILGEEKQVLYTESGKPYIVDSSCYISISHTKGYVAVALDEKQPVAIDIERISSRVENIRSRFMNEIEEQNLSKTHPVIHLLLHWSAKETLFKYLDESDIEFQSQLYIHPFEPVTGEWNECTAHETRTEQQQKFHLSYFVAQDYVITALPSKTI